MSPAATSVTTKARGLRRIVERATRPRRGSPARADAARPPAPRPTPRRPPDRRRRHPAMWPMSPAAPAPGAASVAANGMVGSSQCRCSPTSMVAHRPRTVQLARTARGWARSARLRLRLGQAPAASPASADSGFSARRFSDRPIASIRLRVAASMSSASSSSRASRRSRRVASGSAMRASARARLSAAFGSRRVEREDVAFRADRLRVRPKPARSVAPAVRASTWRRTRRRNASVGFGRRCRCPRAPGPSSARRAAQPARGQRAGGLQRRFQRRLQVGRSATSSSIRRFRPRARDRPPSAPSSQRRSSAVSRPRQIGRERAVRGVEHDGGPRRTRSGSARRCRPARPRPPGS